MCPYSNYYPCSIEGCEKPVVGHGWCGMHLARWRKHGSTADRPPAGSWKIGISYTTKHGHGAGGKRTPTYVSWQAMVNRCTLPSHPRYQRYGGRGITVYEPWRTFANFLADMGERPEGLTLDRIDNDGNYEPGNCRWATRAQQYASRSNGRKRAQ